MASALAGGQLNVTVADGVIGVGAEQREQFADDDRLVLGVAA